MTSFPVTNSSIAQAPTTFLESGFTAPFPTNSPWQNFVLNGGVNPESVLPYVVQLNSTGVAFGFPSRSVTSSFIIQAFVADLLLTVAGGFASRPSIFSYSKLGVTIGWKGKVNVPLIFGSPYLTFALNAETPIFLTPHPVISVTPNEQKTKHRVVLGNGQIWLIYSSSEISFSQSLAASSAFTGIIRVAIIPANDNAAEAVLDYHSPVYPTSGRALVGYFKIVYDWKSQSWDPSRGENDLLMITLPTHRISLKPVRETCGGNLLNGGNAANYVVSTLDGPGMGLAGSRWELFTGESKVGWHSSGGISDPQSISAIRAALIEDVSALAPISASDSYFFNKAAARAARLALIAEEVGLSEQIPIITSFLVSALTPWLDGTFPGNGLVYDSKWGGLVSRNGAADANADFGNGYYNDHHFHYGYFLYASAVLTKFNSTWGYSHKKQIYSILGDFFTLDPKSPVFTELRHFDPYKLHSWASGLFDFADGRNQESSSEAINAYYAVSLVGLAFGDLRLASRAATVAAFETQTTQLLWQIPVDSKIYEGTFVNENRIAGIVWANKVDSGLWFASAQDRVIRLGIQVIPLTPYTEKVFSISSFARQIVEWAQEAPGSSSDGWNGFLWAVQAVYDNQSALTNANTLAGYDDGNSKSNLLWWILSRP